MIVRFLQQASGHVGNPDLPRWVRCNLPWEPFILTEFFTRSKAIRQNKFLYWPNPAYWWPDESSPAFYPVWSLDPAPLEIMPLALVGDACNRCLRNHLRVFDARARRWTEVRQLCWVRYELPTNSIILTLQFVLPRLASRQVYVFQIVASFQQNQSVILVVKIASEYFRSVRQNFLVTKNRPKQTFSPRPNSCGGIFLLSFYFSLYCHCIILQLNFSPPPINS